MSAASFLSDDLPPRMRMDSIRLESLERRGSGSSAAAAAAAAAVGTTALTSTTSDGNELGERLLSSLGAAGGGAGGSLGRTGTGDLAGMTPPSASDFYLAADDTSWVGASSFDAPSCRAPRATGNQINAPRLTCGSFGLSHFLFLFS